MERDMHSILLQDLRSQSEQIGRLRGDIQGLEARLRASISTTDAAQKAALHRESTAIGMRLKAIQRDVKEIAVKVNVPLWKQLWQEWYIRLAILIMAGLMNIDPKQAIALVLGLK